MPELPEVETVRRTLLPHVVDQTVVATDVHDGRLRQAVDSIKIAQLLGRRVLAVRRRAKYLLFDVQDKMVLMIHLGMSGRLGVVPANRLLQKHDHVEFGLSNGTCLRFNDPRRFGLVDVFAASDEVSHPRLIRLGAEPLDESLFNAEMLYQISRFATKPVKNFLMDGNRIVGVGNIYACESLFAAGVHPARAAGRLSLQRCQRLVLAVRTTLQLAIEAGGTTLRDFRNVEGRAGYFAVNLRVYGREGQPCPRCPRTVRRVVQAGRSTFFCPGCQH